MEGPKITVENTGYAIFGPPKNVGRWKMPGANTFFFTTQKPRWLTRFLMKHLMQWEWQDG